MELIDTGYGILMAGTIYEFNLDLLTKKLTLKISLQIYDPKKEYTKEERKRIVLRYYELRLINIKKLNFETLVFRPGFGVTLEDIAVFKIKDNEYEVGMDIGGHLGDLVVRCENHELLDLFENEMEHTKAYEF